MSYGNGNGVGRVARVGEPVSFQVGNQVATCTIQNITPEVARAFLEKEHPSNRKTPSVAQRYAMEMASGGWRPTPEPIMFSTEGYLINGGNRMRAIIQSGQSCLMTVWRNWPDDAFQCVDRNASRTLYQADMMSGKAPARTIYQMARAMIAIDHNRTVISDTEVREHAAALAPSWEALGKKLGAIKIGGHPLRIPAMLAVCVGWFSEPDLTNTFLDELTSALAHESTPSAAVRNFIRWYENSGKTRGGYGTKEAAYAMSGALRQFSLRTDYTQLRATEDAWRFWRVRRQVDEAFVDCEHASAKSNVFEGSRADNRRKQERTDKGQFGMLVSP